MKDGIIEITDISPAIMRRMVKDGYMFFAINSQKIREIKEPKGNECVICFALRHGEIVCFDRIVVYWGKDRRHDIPFLRTRCLKWHKEFPLYREIFITDCYDLARNKLRLHRNRLENVCDFFGIPSKAHRLDAEIWQKAKLGHKPSIDHVWEHNKEDVDSLKAIYELLDVYSASRRQSI